MNRQALSRSCCSCSSDQSLFQQLLISDHAYDSILDIRRAAHGVSWAIAPGFRRFSFEDEHGTAFALTVRKIFLNCHFQESNLKHVPFRQKKLAYALTLAIAAFGASSSYAQKAPATDVKDKKESTENKAAVNGDNPLGSVVVTAQRRSEKLQEVPVAISVIGADTVLKSDQIHTANDITQFIPNASAASTDGRSRPRWFLRGIGTNETAASTVSPIGIYNDDVFLNNVYIQAFPLFDTERVEVLRGPQGTLWGKNTTGGAINFISKKPTFDTNGYAKISYGSFNEKILQGAVGGTLVDDKLAARISVYDENRDGWVDNITTGTKAGAVSDSALRAQALWLLTDDLDLLFSLRTRKAKGDVNPSFYVRGPQQVIPNPIYLGAQRGADAIAAASNGQEEIESDGASVTANWAIGRYSLTSITSFDKGKRTNLSASTFALPISNGYQLTDSRQFTQELRLASPKQDKVSWIVGAHYFDESMSNNSVSRSNRVANASRTSAAGFSAASWNQEQYDQDTTSKAIFGSLTYNITEKLALITGLRRSTESKDFNLNYLQSTNSGSGAANSATFNDTVPFYLPGSVTNGLDPLQTANQSATWSNTTYDFTPQYKINENINTYARYSHGFRAGGFVVDQPTAATRTIKKLEPETLDALELGLKTQWLDGRLTLNTAIFGYKYKDKIEAVLLPSATSASGTRQVQENAADGYSRGLEVELGWLPTSNFRVSGSLGYLSTKYTNYSSTASGQTLNATGNKFSRAPELSATLDLEYRIPLASGAGIVLGTDWSYRTKQYFNAIDQAEPTLWQDAYSFGNARIAYQAANGKYEVAAFVRNLTDEVYSVLATGSATGNSATREVYGLPRTFGVTLTAKF
ncbi:TonB-dependent receptor [Janthinobacterium sp. 17J80-10]|uniref:TonB-dependent receptor n=1 Tax=Janthinobacterium sp. 17J80-10 TaxID=2497863 RepID=UPI00100555BB|nr:TonB-dependent receptor [Janthinobacterium sp. 17J80-10]QAU33975.1 TonB-dependent receptor [Janthinobacterium sp. 17J80-10]